MDVAAVAGGRTVGLKPMRLPHACLTSRDRLQMVFWRGANGAGLGAPRLAMRGRAALAAVQALRNGQWRFALALPSCAMNSRGLVHDRVSPASAAMVPR